jgi:hypothetical protein
LAWNLHQDQDAAPGVAAKGLEQADPQLSGIQRTVETPTPLGYHLFSGSFQ